MKERTIAQPEIKIPNDNDPLKWARHAIVMEKWIRHVAPQLGIDTEKYILGYVIGKIIGDDENAWGYPYLNDLPRKAIVLERLNWEIGIAELPRAIKNRLGEAKSVVEAVTWSDGGWVQAKNAWLGVKEWIEQEKDKPGVLNDACRYYDENEERLTPYYMEFLRMAEQEEFGQEK